VGSEKAPKLAVWKFSSCDGCQLSLLDCEDQLLEVAHAVDVAYFLEASTATAPGPYDVSLVEGSIANEHDISRLKEVREQSKLLISIGACAVGGGVQALRNFGDLQSYIDAVYSHPEYIDSSAVSTPISQHVTVDAELRGCPVSKTQLLEVIGALLQGRKPYLPIGAVCLECKQRGNTCVMVTRSLPCLGPVTHAGCGALCPSYGRACYGCFGPKESANTKSLKAWFEGRLKLSQPELDRLFCQINCLAPEHPKESQA
jgi:sulfhydrogenase subunit delta